MKLKSVISILFLAVITFSSAGCKKKPDLVGRWQLTGYDQITYSGYYQPGYNYVDTIIYTLDNHVLLLYDNARPKINSGTIWMQLNIDASDSITINQISSEPGYKPQNATYYGSYSLTENASQSKIDFHRLGASFLFFGMTRIFQTQPYTYTIETLTEEKLVLKLYQNSPRFPDEVAENNCRLTFTRY